MNRRKLFIEGIIALGRILNISLSHEDTQGAFVLHIYDEKYANWLRDAHDERNSKDKYISGRLP